MNPLAHQLNETIRHENEQVYAMLSRLGQEIYFPKEGILSQSAEASSKAKKFNATIGIATEGGAPMHLPVIQDALSAFEPKDIYPYAPPAGKPELRKPEPDRKPELHKPELHKPERHKPGHRPVCSNGTSGT